MSFLRLIYELHLFYLHMLISHHRKKFPLNIFSNMIYSILNLCLHFEFMPLVTIYILDIYWSQFQFSVLSNNLEDFHLSIFPTIWNIFIMKYSLPYEIPISYTLKNEKCSLDTYQDISGYSSSYFWIYLQLFLVISPDRRM